MKIVYHGRFQEVYASGSMQTSKIIAALVTLCAIALLLPQPIKAQSPLQEIQLTITDYEEEKVVPGSTFVVRFSAYKPAGIKILDSRLAAYAYYRVGDEFVNVYVPIPTGYKDISLPSPAEENVEGELEIRISRTAPVGQLITLDVLWYIAGVSVTIDENENLVAVEIGENIFTTPIVHALEKANYTRYYLVRSFAQATWVRSDRPDRLYVSAKLMHVEILPERPGIHILVWYAASAVSVCILIAMAIYWMKKRGEEERVTLRPAMERPPPIKAEVPFRMPALGVTDRPTEVITKEGISWKRVHLIMGSFAALILFLFAILRLTRAPLWVWLVVFPLFVLVDCLVPFLLSKSIEHRRLMIDIPTRGRPDEVREAIISWLEQKNFKIVESIAEEPIRGVKGRFSKLYIETTIKEDVFGCSIHVEFFVKKFWCGDVELVPKEKFFYPGWYWGSSKLIRGFIEFLKSTGWVGGSYTSTRS
jgi:hypothetical protein